jgi:hypothetical protein
MIALKLFDILQHMTQQRLLYPRHAVRPRMRLIRDLYQDHLRNMVREDIEIHMQETICYLKSCGVAQDVAPAQFEGRMKYGTSQG